ncbi:Xaa-Pro dipeptidase [Parashewanella curva]|uniref:Xaa-Pro dipeptidase n=1 Tax=Parashewanella curva TaxID=2338552 RepID=A0A3L8PZM5_9GAMM|nr:Xaa-Pro dipeptidase [Parashewanella curva]RLV60811.1 Xaa-Pro dipeptidase [Parashewanella curva]
MTIGQHFSQHIAELNQRTREICQRENLSGLVIHSGQLKYQFLDDMAYPFKVNPNFKGWLPLIDNPNCWVVTDGCTKPTLIYYRPVDFWHKVSDVPETYWTNEFDIKLLTKADQVDTLLPSNIAHWAYLGDEVSFAEQLGFSHINPSRVENYLHFQRSFKTEYELDCLREANRLAVNGHLAAKQAFLSGGSEFDIQLEYLKAVGQGENDVPYNNIIALNENAAILHYMILEHQKPAEHRSFLIDAGATCGGYASDITRTYSAEQNRFASLIAAMDKLQHEIIAEMKVGKSYVDLHLLTHQKVAQVLLDSELATGNPELLIDSGITRAFFPHGLGHMLGLQVHDVAGFSSDEQGTHVASPAEHPFLRCTRTLDVGQVLTIEPGLYIIDTLLSELDVKSRQQVNWKVVDELRPFGGIRIEDNVIVHADRIENMTRDFGLA